MTGVVSDAAVEVDRAARGGGLSEQQAAVGDHLPGARHDEGAGAVLARRSGRWPPRSA
jgi:hypothetical protein